MSLTADDRLEIHDLYARYAHTFDQADAAGWTALFTPEGRFAPPGLEPIVGAEALHAFVANRSGDLPGMRHLIANVTIQATRDGAQGSAYFCCFRLGGDGKLRMRNFGRYDDVLHRYEGAWRFADRDIVAELPVELVDLPFAFA